MSALFWFSNLISVSQYFLNDGFLESGQEKLGNYYSIHNNLEYAEALANGHSPQADAGWIDLIGKEMQAYVRSQYEKIKRQG